MVFCLVVFQNTHINTKYTKYYSEVLSTHFYLDVTFFPEHYLGNEPRGSGGFDLTFRTLSEKCNSPSVNRGNVESHGRNSFSHDRSVDRALRNDFLNLSTNRQWNLFKLLWLPVLFGFGTEQPPLFAFAGLDINDACEFRDEAREICGLDVFRLLNCIGWLRCDGETAFINSDSGDVDKLGHSDRLSDTFLELHALDLEQSDARRERPVL